MEIELIQKIKDRLNQEVSKLLSKQELSTEELSFLEHISGNYLYSKDIIEITQNSENDEMMRESNELYKNAMEKFNDYVDSLGVDFD